MPADLIRTADAAEAREAHDLILQAEALTQQARHALIRAFTACHDSETRLLLIEALEPVTRAGAWLRDAIRRHEPHTRS